MIQLPTREQIDRLLGEEYPPHRKGRPAGKPRGRFVLWDVYEDGRWEPKGLGHNSYLYTGGFIAARAVGLGDATFKVSTMYMEYSNTLPPVTPPSVSRADTISYYENLVAPKDYLRLPLLFEPTISIVPGYEAYFDSSKGEGNRLTFYAQSTGTVGVLGLPFSDTANSTVIGVGLVATPTPSDRTKDYLLARGYLATSPTNLQKTKVPNAQIGVTWTFDWL